MENPEPKLRIRFFRSENATEMPTSSDLAKLGIEKEDNMSYTPESTGYSDSINKISISTTKKIIGPFVEYNYFPLPPYNFHQAAYITNRLLPRKGHSFHMLLTMESQYKR